VLNAAVAPLTAAPIVIGSMTTSLSAVAYTSS
jgi:hypothetical protein